MFYKNFTYPRFKRALLSTGDIMQHHFIRNKSILLRSAVRYHLAAADAVRERNIKTVCSGFRDMT